LWSDATDARTFPFSSNLSDPVIETPALRVPQDQAAIKGDADGKQIRWLERNRPGSRPLHPARHLHLVLIDVILV
jgi:hypothetical protein